MPPIPPKAVIFDCDGVLVDSEPAGFELLFDDLRHYGLTLDFKAIEAAFIGLTIPNVWTKAREMGANLPEDWIHTFYDRLYDKLAQGTALVPGIPELMERLDAAGIPYAVGSNGSDHKMQITLGQHPAIMAKLEGRLFSGQTLGKPKPAPDLYLHAAAALGVAPADCVVVDDSVTGCRAGVAAGMRCMGFAAHDDGAALAAVGAEPFHRMADLPALIGLAD